MSLVERIDERREKEKNMMVKINVREKQMK